MLSYLFFAHFENGLIISQNAENKSERFENKSCYTDVLDEVGKGNRLVLFELKRGENTAAVNLTNGEVVVSSPSVSIRYPAPKEKLTNFRPIYFYSVSQSLGDGAAKQILAYKIGWQANGENGENIQFGPIEIY